jgi:hypothetical protein
MLLPWEEETEGKTMPDPTQDSALEETKASLPKAFHELPHGFLKPPQEVLDALAREKAKFLPEIYGREYEERALNEWTVDYVFGHQQGYYDDVLYRPTPAGPEVLAVGGVAIRALTKDMPDEDRAQLKTWTPW